MPSEHASPHEPHAQNAKHGAVDVTEQFFHLQDDEVKMNHVDAVKAHERHVREVTIDEDFAAQLGIKLEDLKRCDEAFRSADADNSGYVNHEELVRILQLVYEHPLPENDIATLLTKHDVDNSGALDFYEFMQVYCETPLHKADHLEAIINQMRNNIKNETLSNRPNPEDAVEQGLVKLGTLKHHLKDELEQMHACIQLPWAILIFISFTVSVLVHERVEEVHAVDAAFSADLIENGNFAFSGKVPFENGRMGFKNYQNVNSVADFWSWFNLGLVPLFWPEGWEVSEARTNTLARCTAPKDSLEAFGGWDTAYLANMSNLPPVLGGECPERAGFPSRPAEFFGTHPSGKTSSVYRGYHLIIGGVRLRQERMKMVECPDGNAFNGLLRTGLCVTSSGHYLEPDFRASLVSDPSRVNTPGGKDVYLLSNTPQKDIRKQLRGLENEGWLDHLTGKVEIIFTSYNAHMDVFTATYILYFMNLSGHIYSKVQPVSFAMTPYHNIWCYIADGVWLLMILKIYVEEGRDLILHIKMFGFKKGNGLYWGLENLVDWTNVVYFGIIVFLWTRHLQKVEQLRDILKQTGLGVPGNFLEMSVREEFYNHIETFVQEVEVRRGVLAIYPFIIVSRFFKAFSAQPRLALVTNTIWRAGTDLLHFGLVFMAIFGLFTVAATLLFGRDMHEFATLERSLHSCFRVLLGDFDWDDMKETGRTAAGIWFWSFSWLVQLVMLNMLLAIVMDIYTEVRGKIGEGAQTLWSQAFEIERRYRQKQLGARVTLEYIMEYIEPEGPLMAKGIHNPADDEPMTVEGFMGIVPGLSEKQATRLLIASEYKRRDNEHESVSISEAIVDIQKIELRVEQLHEAFQNVSAVGEMSATMQMSISKSVVAIQDSERTQQKDAMAVSMPFGGDQGMRDKFDVMFEKLARHSLDCADKLEAKLDDRAQNLTAIVTKMATMLGEIQAAQAGSTQAGSNGSSSRATQGGSGSSRAQKAAPTPPSARNGQRSLA